MTDKLRDYETLVATRKACFRCEGLVNPYKCAGGMFDPGDIGVWSSWQGGLDAFAIVVGQDWGNAAAFVLQRGRDNASQTNRMLKELLESAGLQISLPSGLPHRDELFFTNAILCLKPDRDQKSPHSQWLANCGEHFLKPQIELVRPELVICLGECAYNAVLRAYGIRRRPFRQAVEAEEPTILSSGIPILPAYHCSPNFREQRRPLVKQRQDWRRIGAVVQRLRSQRGGAA
jgi:uracil-DNA glycosylase family 4